MLQTSAVLDTYAEPPDVWRRLAQLAGARPDQPICVAGPHGLDGLVALCRDGYGRVEFARQATCACADEGADVLMIDGDCASDVLVGLIQRTVRLLRNGGVLAIRWASLRDQKAVVAALASDGFHITGSAHAGSRRLAAFTLARRAPLRLAS